jgi:GT2 family glycosyltransferase
MYNNIFVLTYSSAQEFFKNTKPLSNSLYYLIDNGSQKYNPTFGCNFFTTSRNIGCAGGWNLICDIAFDHLDLDKIVITQDDAIINPELISQALEETNGLSITGIIQPFFEFSTFVITKEVWHTVGRFDENFIYVYSEDADYKQRCLLSGVLINSLYVPNKEVNFSSSVKHNPSLNKIDYNRQYLKFKWGDSMHPNPAARLDGQPPFANKTPFEDMDIMKYDNQSSMPLDYIPLTSRITSVYGDISDFPSKIEYERFKKHGFS